MISQGTDLRLLAAPEDHGIDQGWSAVQLALLLQAEAHTGHLIPGYTHLQGGPSLSVLATNLMALPGDGPSATDRGWPNLVRGGVNNLPLGAAGPWAGTPVRIDRRQTAAESV